MNDKKYDILTCSIDEDQDAVASQWANTFLHNPADDPAINMTQLLIACVAAGDFKTRSFLSKIDELQAPSDQLAIIDYLSHASRIILDYQQLNESNAAELLNYFPVPDTKNGIVARSATHNVNRNNYGNAIEGKGLLLGVVGQLPALLKTPRDFGVNIAMGGTDQENYYGKKISANGCSGHFYFHRNETERLLLLGLEQTAPAASVVGLLFSPAKSPEGVQQDYDQFGQGHSLKGASDTYTAAGSLYFSDPIYQAKLLLEKGCFPPDKYGAMQVTINDKNWLEIKSFFDALKSSVNKNSSDELLLQLKKKPSTAIPVEKDYLSYIALDFTSYLQKIYQVCILDSDMTLEEKKNLQDLQTELLSVIKKLHNGNFALYSELTEAITKITEQSSSQHYKEGINRIGELFKLQHTIDPQMQNTYQTLLLQRQYQDLQIEGTELLGQLLALKQYFQAEYIAKDTNISLYLQELEEQIGFFKRPNSTKSEEGSNDELTRSWVVCSNNITNESIDTIRNKVEQAKTVLKKAPKLYPQTTVNALQQLAEKGNIEKQELESKLIAQHTTLEQTELQLTQVTEEKNGLAEKLKSSDIEIKQQIVKANQEKNELEAKLQTQETKLEQTQTKLNEVTQEKESLADKLQSSEEEMADKINDSEQQFKKLITNRVNLTLARTTRIAPVLNNIKEMQEQALDLSARKHFHACKQANDLITKLEQEVKIYINNTIDTESEALNKFKNACTTQLNIERKELSIHRGFKRLIGNTLLAIGLLGVGYLAAIALHKYQSGHYLFFNDTKSVQKLSEIKNSILNLPNAPQEQNSPS